MSRRSQRQLDPVDGILLLDKCLGISSNRALQQVKHLFNARKAGHTGSLDPLASGLLPLCFGEATKLSQYLLDSDKRYLTTFKLGETTTTCDGEGDVISQKTVNVSSQQLELVLNKYKGVIKQVPPMYSALKKNGQPLYKLARKGIEVKRKPRSVEIFDLSLLAFDAELLTLDVHCSKGFYIRSLAFDIGEGLGCGAHVTELRRTAAGKFDVRDAVKLEQLQEMDDQRRLQQLLPVDAGIDDMPRVSLAQDAWQYFRQGQMVRADDVPQAGLVRVYSENGYFTGIGEALEDRQVKPKRLLSTNS
ncbi:tRNA pseudouridine synthase B [bacterium BMS3Bbin11]|nr:tRNA pseudouridine synthase B [bacterium BMS3Bbin11]HDH09054.1 tRNA pseudouridine(55) synthase TruB [Gammaproteobacteria bacterium]